MDQSIYIFRTDKNECKIGVSCDVTRRKNTITSQGNNNIIDTYYTLPCSNAHEIEGKTHKYFAEYRGIGEWFNVDYKIACDKLAEIFDKYAVFNEDDVAVEPSSYHLDSKKRFKSEYPIYLSNDIIDDLSLTDEEFAVYISLRSIYISGKTTQYVSYNMLCYELFGHSDYTTIAYRHICNGFDSLVKKGLVIISKKLSSKDFEVNLQKLYFKPIEEFFTIIYTNEIRSIMNITSKIDKFKILRYFTVCIRSFCMSEEYFKNYYGSKRNFVGFMSQSYLCSKTGINYQTNSKLALQYNAILEENHLLYIHRHTEMKRDKETGQIKSFVNHYGRYSDKDDIDTYANNYEKACGVTEEIVQSESSNKKRSLSAKYNNLCSDFGRYSEQYSSDELVDIYKQVHSNNEAIEQLIDELNVKESSEYYDRLISKIRDEDILKQLPCVMAFINNGFDEAAV